MFSQGNILHIDKFEFKDGELHPNGKFIVILSFVNNNIIYFEIATKQDNVPDSLKIKNCIHEHNKRIHCYIIKKGEKICENNFTFPKDTFLYFHQNIEERKIIDIQKAHINGITISGKIKKTLLIEILECAVMSSLIKQKFTKHFLKDLEILKNS